MSNDKKVSGYVAFTAALIAQFERAQVPLVPMEDPSAEDKIRGNEGWALFEVAGTGDKVYVNRTKGAPTKVETTVPFDLIPTAVVAQDMRTQNGKIEARVTPDVEQIAVHLIPVLAERHRTGARIRAARLPARAAG